MKIHEGSGRVRHISGCLAPYPPLYKENSHRIFTFCMDPTGQLRGVRGRLPGIVTKPGGTCPGGGECPTFERKNDTTNRSSSFRRFRAMPRRDADCYLHIDNATNDLSYRLRHLRTAASTHVTTSTLQPAVASDRRRRDE